MKTRTMWIWISLGSLVALVSFVLLVGLLLPDTYRARGSVLLAAPPDAVWAELLDAERHPHAGRMARSVERLPDEGGRAVWIEDIGESRVRVVTVEAVENERLVRELADGVVPMTARWTVELSAAQGGTRLVLENRTVIRRGTWHVPLFRVLMTLTRGAEKGVAEWVDGIEPGAGKRIDWER